MLRTALLALFALAVAIGGGAASVWYALSAPEGVGAVSVGGWTSYPDLGTPEADPYSKARVARDGLLALGRAEGMAFVAQHDAAGQALRRECRYTLHGPVPAARLWTLFAANPNGRPIAAGERRQGFLNSQGVLFEPDNSLTVSIGPQPAPGNWLATEGTGLMSLVLTLYDTPVATSTGMSDITLPRVTRAGCDG